MQDKLEKPTLVYDGECFLCRLWVERARQFAGDSVCFLPSSHPGLRERFPQIPADHYEKAVQWVDANGRSWSGAAAIGQMLAYSGHPVWRMAEWFRQHVPMAGFLADWCYQIVARNRRFLSLATRFTRGSRTLYPGISVTSWWFLRILGLIFLVAFLSWGRQVQGLVGSQGILPVADFLHSINVQCDATGIHWERYWLVPTLNWFGTGDGWLSGQCAAGAAAALMVVLDMAPALFLFLCWLLYLSLATSGQDFMGFQWDNLLLETGFLSIFLAPLRWLPRLPGPTQPPGAALWLLRFLLFKLTFSSGCVKWLSNDPNWHHLTALQYHYQTQPLPTWLAWYANLLPENLQKASCLGVFLVEWFCPFLIFAPRYFRFAGALAMAGLQGLILLTGNYTFFNYLTLALCLLLLDDGAWPECLTKLPHRIIPPWQKTFGFVNTSSQSGPPPIHRWPRWVIYPLALVIGMTSASQVVEVLGGSGLVPPPITQLAAEIAPLRTINSYGLFAVMTTQRFEISVEGSNDGTEWQAYEFKAKPGDLNRAPGFVAPGQPRLDWQMWFAALGTADQNPWFIQFCNRLLEGSKPVTNLLRHNPFASAPPRYIRAQLYLYRFTTPKERQATGNWWHRDLAGTYLPPIERARP